VSVSVVVLVLEVADDHTGLEQGPLSIRRTFGGPPAVANTSSKSITNRSAVIDRSTTCSSETRVCSSIIETILMALPSMVESNWKSIAHTTFGASASIGGIEDTVECDLVDPITIFIATGLRRSELLALRWVDLDTAAGTLAVTGKLVRISGEGLKRLDTGEDRFVPSNGAVARIRPDAARRASIASLLGRAPDDLHVVGSDVARPRQLQQAVAQGSRRAGRT
jgi:hypothetical protein